MEGVGEVEGELFISFFVGLFISFLWDCSFHDGDALKRTIKSVRLPTQKWLSFCQILMNFRFLFFV